MYSSESPSLSQVSRIADSEESVMLMLGRCLPHIVPNVLLAKREVRPRLLLLFFLLSLYPFIIVIIITGLLSFCSIDTHRATRLSRGGEKTGKTVRLAHPQPVNSLSNLVFIFRHLAKINQLF